LAKDYYKKAAQNLDVKGFPKRQGRLKKNRKIGLHPQLTVPTD
jgi:hypothetical protein